MLVVVLSTFAAVAFAAPPLGTHQKNTEPCGLRPLVSRAPAISPLIVGGNEVNPPYSYPWMCGLTSTSSHSPFCGASLIKNRENVYHLLTAAHCISASQASTRRAFCGAHDRSNQHETHRQILTFSQVITHPNYSPNTYANDVAVIKLTNQPEENDYVRAVCLPSTNYSSTEMATATGWGRLSSGGAIPQVLMEVEKPIVSDSDCQSAYGNAFHPSSMMCSAGSGKDACQGDSGGPLVVERNDTWEEVGIVSWGYGCADPRYPGVYADVLALKDWILLQIQ